MDDKLQVDIVKSILALVPAIIAAVPTVADRIGRRAHQQEATAILDCLKKKYELEALRKKEQLDVPRVPITEEELRRSNPTSHEQKFFRPESLRLTFTYRLLRQHHKLCALVSLMGSVVITYAIALFWLGLFQSTAIIDEVVKITPLPRDFVKGIGVLYLVSALGLMVWGMRVILAKRLAAIDNHAASAGPAGG